MNSISVLLEGIKKSLVYRGSPRVKTEECNEDHRLYSETPTGRDKGHKYTFLFVLFPTTCFTAFSVFHNQFLLGYVFQFSVNTVLSSGLQKGYGTNHKVLLTIICWSLLSDFSANVSTVKSTYYHDKINNSPKSRMLFKTFSSLFCPTPSLNLTCHILH